MAKAQFNFGVIAEVIVAFGVIASGLLYIGSVDSRAQTTKERLDRVSEKMQRMESEAEAKLGQISVMLIEIRDRTARIEQWQKDREH